MRDDRPLVTIACPVRNGAGTLGPVLESALAQDYPHLEVVIGDNASTDGTEELCRDLARRDPRVSYLRHPANVGLLNNFRGVAEASNGSFVRWLGDADALEPDYVSRTLATFAEDPRRVLVTTQMTYVDEAGVVTTSTAYDPTPLDSPDPVTRFAEMLRLLTSGFALLDPLYAMMRREVAVLPRRNILREDEVFAARLALAGPWGHVAAPLARRERTEVDPAGLTRLLGVPAWHQHAADLIQARELLDWVGRSTLDPGQRRRARQEVLRLYARRKRNKVRRGTAKLQRTVGGPVGLRTSGAQ